MDEPIENYEITQLHISVRNLVEFILRSGDIEESEEATDSLKSMQEGIKLHRFIQKNMPSDYHEEVPLSHIVSFDNYELVIDGRADGILHNQDDIPVLIDEIKGTHKDLERVDKAAVVHEAQAMCYGFFCAYINNLPGMDIQITYGNLKSREIKRFVNYYTYEDLEEFFLDLIDRYKPFSDYIYKWSITRRESISNMVFPFEHREGQKPIMGHVYNAIKDNELLFVQAPTGVGKTISMIYPSLKAMNDFGLSKIFYLTAKTITKKVAKDTFNLLREKGNRFKMLEITARDKICPLEERVCDASHCEYAKGHYDRINDV
ncbi:MAG: ATP-dependent DNA helicase, partial [Lachnospiraceae bacterium]|nr:ATP-dependent DNA helicase [Lachnospiraceae bacterium]